MTSVKSLWRNSYSFYRGLKPVNHMELGNAAKTVLFLSLVYCESFANYRYQGEEQLHDHVTILLATNMARISSRHFLVIFSHHVTFIILYIHISKRFSLSFFSFFLFQLYHVLIVILTSSLGQKNGVGEYFSNPHILKMFTHVWNCIFGQHIKHK